MTSERTILDYLADIHDAITAALSFVEESVQPLIADVLRQERLAAGLSNTDG